jgi:uncharacterized protein YndB with AHSA1/START domain
MPEVAYRAVVAYPPEVVFAYVADAENNPRWHAHVDETRWIDAPPTRIGRRGRQTGRLFGRSWAFVAEVAEYEPPRRVAFQVINGYRVRTTIEVEPGADGGSILTLTVRTPRLPGPLDGLVGRALRRSTEARSRGDIERLRAALAAMP